MVERHRSIRRLVDARRERERHVQRPDRAGDEARLLGRLRSPVVGGATREASTLEAHLPRGLLERVVGLADPGRGEGVRRRNVCSGGEVVVVDRGDDLRLREVQEIGIPADVARMGCEPLAAVLLLRELTPVDEHAPRPVEHEDPLGEKLSELVASVLHASVLHKNPLPPKEVGSRKAPLAL